MADFEKIYVDMDGVLANFDKGVSELLKLEVIPQEKQTDEQVDIMWNAVKEYGHFYLDLDPIIGSIEAINYLCNKYHNKVEILTAIPKPRRGIEYANADKLEWMKKYFPEDIKVNVVYRADKKEFCKGKDYILIDDYNKNVNEWNNNGGTGILFKTWNEVISDVYFK